MKCIRWPKAEFDSNQKYTVEQFPDDIQAIYRKPESEKTTYEKQLSYLVYRQAQRAATNFDYVKALKDKPEKLARYQELQEELKRFDSIKPAPLPEAFVATDMGPEPAPTYLLTRTTKEAVEPSFLTLLGQKPTIKPTDDQHRSPYGAGKLDRRRKQSVLDTCDRESCLATSLWIWHRPDSERLWHPGRTTESSGIARLANASVSRWWLEA